MTVLALSEPHRVRFEEWQALCSVLGTDFDVAELRTIGEESPFVTVDPTDGLPVVFTHERDARTLREEVPVGTFQAFQQAVVDRLFACTDSDPLDDCLTRALPAHAAAAGRFEELLADPRTLVKCSHTALLNALRMAFPDSIPAGSYAADLYYLRNLGLAPSSQAEWVSLLHLLALSQGDTERAEALIESTGPVPWRTVWTHWRAPGRVRPRPPQIDGVEELQAAADGTTVTSRTVDRLEQTWHAATGRLLEATGQFLGAKGPFIEDAPPTPRAPLRWEAETSWNLVRTAAVGDPSTLRVLQAPKVKDVACAGDLVVLGGSRGIYAIVCLQWKYMLAYRTSGGLDGEDLIDELRSWLAGIDPAAAATRNWGHVTDTDEFVSL